MSIFKNKSENKTKVPLADQLAAQAKKLGISVDELKKLGLGKSCPKYGTSELLHARRGRGGQIMVFNISDRLRGEKISATRSKGGSTTAVVDSSNK